MTLISIKNILSVIICIVTAHGFAQSSFIKAYGNTGFDFSRDIQQDNDTGYVITGSSSSFSPDNGDAYLLKLDVSGNFEWSHNYGGSGADWGEALVITNDSTYAIGGYTNSFGAGGFDFYAVRINADGSPAWEKTYGGADWDRAFGMVQLADSGFVLVGESYSFNDGLQHGYMVRIDKNGDVIWEQSITEDLPSFFRDVAFDGDSIVVCGGIGDGGEETFDGFILKYGIDGGLGWERRIGREYNDYFNAVYSVGGLYSFAGTRAYNFPTEKENMWMYRTEDNGTEVFDTTFINFSPNSDILNDVSVRDFDQDYYYVGQTKSYGFLLDGLNDIFLGKMTFAATPITANNYGERGDDIGQAIANTRDGGVVFVCDTRFFATGGHNILIIKLNSFWEYPVLFDVLEYQDITNSITENPFEGAEVIDVYPNPFTAEITLPEINTNNSQYFVYGLDGQLVAGEKLNSNTINLAHLQNGIYLLTVQTEDAIYKKRIIKN